MDIPAQANAQFVIKTIVNGQSRDLIIDTGDAAAHRTARPGGCVAEVERRAFVNVNRDAGHGRQRETPRRFGLAALDAGDTVKNRLSAVASRCAANNERDASVGRLRTLTTLAGFALQSVQCQPGATADVGPVPGGSVEVAVKAGLTSVDANARALLAIDREEVRIDATVGRPRQRVRLRRGVSRWSDRTSSASSPLQALP